MKHVIGVSIVVLSVSLVSEYFQMILHRLLEALKTVIRFVESLNLSVSAVDDQNVVGRFVVLE